MRKSQIILLESRTEVLLIYISFVNLTFVFAEWVMLSSSGINRVIETNTRL